MPGTVSFSKMIGARSETLAEYFLSHGGPVLRGRDESDYGVDLFCALAARSGSQMLLSRPYTVQVKSNYKPWKFQTPKDIEWFVNHPSPFFLAVVDRKSSAIDIYQTFARFDLFVHAAYPTPLVLRPGKVGKGSVGSWDGKAKDYALSAPIVRVNTSELFDETVLADRIGVLAKWIEIERKNILLRDLGLMRFRGPNDYKTNEGVFATGIEKGLGHVNEQQLEHALHALGESLDCVGSQHGYTKRKDDPETLLLMMMLMRRITAGGKKGLSIHNGASVMAIERFFEHPDDTYVGESIDRAIDKLLAAPSTVTLLKHIRSKK